MSPARTHRRCAAPGCQQARSGDSTLCDDHAYGRRPWRADRERAPRRLCTVPGCEKVHYAHGSCRLHYDRQKRAGVTFPATAPWNPYYADLPCPSCGSRATVPFDPRPERAGRGPSTDLATCVACHHTWPSAPCSSVRADHSPRPVAGEHGGGGRKSLRGVKAAAAAPIKAQPGRANSRAGDAPAVTGTTGAA